MPVGCTYDVHHCDGHGTAGVVNAFCAHSWRLFAGSASMSMFPYRQGHQMNLCLDINGPCGSSGATARLDKMSDAILRHLF